METLRLIQRYNRLKAIAEGLKINSTLKELIYWNNVVSLEGAKYVAESLKVNKGLKALDLDHCGIPAEGIVVIGEALLVNSTLESLSLSKNSVGHGFVQFAKHLGENKGLKRLNLRACGINDVAVVCPFVGAAFVISVSIWLPDCTVGQEILSEIQDGGDAVAGRRAYPSSSSSS